MPTEIPAQVVIRRFDIHVTLSYALVYIAHWKRIGLYIGFKRLCFLLAANLFLFLGSVFESLTLP